MLDLEGLWHPCAVSRATGDAVVPNDLSLGADTTDGYVCQSKLLLRIVVASLTYRMQAVVHLTVGSSLPALI